MTGSTTSGAATSGAATSGAATSGLTALAMIEASAARHPDRIAMEDCNGGGTTYAELLARAHQIAASIVPDSIIELPAERSVDFVIGCLAAWIAGAAWMPIDPSEPAWRLAAIRAALDARDGSAEPRRGAHSGSAEPDALAYVIATSGSSGTPKLVMVAQRGLPALLEAQIAAFELVPGARSLWLHAPRFDASVSDWGTALASGATLVIPAPDVLAAPARLRDELVRRAITHVDLPPALLAHVPPDDPPAGLRVVVLGGEPCPIAPLRALAARLRVVVVYGPTEATVCSSLVVVDPARWSRPLIGEPLPGVVYRVVDGELWIGGACLALGYAGDAAATARQFVALDGARMYRTGDRVEPCDGGLAFAGRIDRQRKLAGVRIELDDIEAVLRRAPGVHEAAAVVATPGGTGGRARLIAFVDGEVAPVALRAWLGAEAPAWMVPARVIVGALPRTATGKIDHAALARRELPGAAASVVAAGDALEQTLAVLWCEALGSAELTGERFRAAGGDSLAQLSLHAAAAAHGIGLDAAALAADPTFVELIAAVRAARPAVMTVAACEARGLAALAMRMTASPMPAEMHAGMSGVARGTASPVASRAASPVASRAASPGVSRARRDAVLVTGATGQLGGALLRAWRDHAALHQRRLIALVRAPDVEAARRRLAATLDPDMEVEILCGDVAQPYLGLPRAAWDALAARLGTVIHAAAHIDLAAGWDAHAAANVDGTAEIARLVAAGQGVAWHHVSTLSVFVNTDHARGVHREAATPPGEAIAHGGYAQTKIAAEAITRAARRPDAPTTILRLGLLVGAPPRAGDQLAMTIRGLARLGAVPAGVGALRFDVTPLAAAAAAVLALAMRAEARGADDTHHIASAAGASCTQLIAAIRVAGHPLDELAPAAWDERARARLGDPEIAMAYLALGRAIGADVPARFELFLATGAELDVGRTAALLAGSHIVVPPVDDAAIARIVRAALRSEQP